MAKFCKKSHHLRCLEEDLKESISKDKLQGALLSTFSSKSHLTYPEEKPQIILQRAVTRAFTYDQIQMSPNFISLNIALLPPL